ncbi:unnamed protein product [Effrenium voratum]|nr:unnamed protein product [Effrenium voratum]
MARRTWRAAVLGLCLWQMCSTFVAPSHRRAALSAMFSALLAAPAVAQEGVPPKTGGRASKWYGTYEDPKHPACERSVVIAFDGTKGKIDGYDKSGSGEEGKFDCRKRRDVQYYDWTLKVQLASKDADEMVVQQAGRDVVQRARLDSPQQITGKWEDKPERGIRWPDGTKWVQKTWQR